MRPTKLAMGIFRFNIKSTSLDEYASNRYCSQVLLPTLSIMAVRKHLKLTAEICGADLEYLAKHYPQAIGYLRELNYCRVSGTFYW